MALWKNTEVMVLSPDGFTNFFDIITGVLQGDRVAPDLLYSAKITYFESQQIY